ncbi:GNAT family N-acetyltransferase [Sphingomonas sp. Leaf343]|uniref:GNAT family N-acetyltransferase n=1 Tax=Sphingomonas sp. Leaf343 TaxID=1736345 RepID=UPI0006FF2B0B|nr:GNAT family N-acetyltransferase [Sphingomonas sp. Leaf343]KQR83683.1 hypothetical protein ASG07_08330 [Sphingomonas sp. Leaf343]
MTTPILSTPRLTLVPHDARDLDEMAAMHADPGFYASLSGKPTPREEVWHRLLRYIGHWRVAGYGHWIVRETIGGEYLGEVGLMDSRRGMIPDFEGVPEAGWGFRGMAQGRGFAQEALAALFDWADPRLPRTVCIIDHDNMPSRRLAERIGYRTFADGQYRDKPILVLDRVSNRDTR